jgi:2-polyprenyl-6-methoxyphenol hydroxylase-like FAD-dependent oxidoreductase
VFARPPEQDRSTALMDFTHPGGLAYLSVPAHLSGRFWIEDAHGVRWADFHKEADRPLVVAVLPDHELFLRSADRELHVKPSRAGQVVDLSNLSWSKPALASRGALDEAFRNDLFQIAYGSRFYAGFVASTGEVPVTPAAGPDLSE